MDAPNQSPAPAQGQTPATDTQLHFLDYWRIIRIRKTVILAVFLLVVLTTTAVTFILDEYFSSSVRIAVEKDVSDIPGLFERQNVSSHDPYFIQTEFEKLQSRKVLYRVIEEMDLNRRWAKENGGVELKTPETFLLLKRRISVSQFRNTSLIEIRVLSKDRSEAAEIANKIAEVYKETRLEVRKELSERGLASLRARHLAQENKVKALQEEVYALRDQYQISDVVAEGGGPNSTLEAETVRGLERDRINAETSYSLMSTKLEELRKLSRADLRKAILTVVADAPLAAYLQTQAEWEQKYTLATKEYTEDHPEVDKIAGILKTIDRQINDRVEGIMKGIENQVAGYRAAADELSREVSKAKGTDTQAMQQYKDYFRKRKELQTESDILQTIKFKLVSEEVNLELPKESIVEITDRAEPGIRPVRPNVTLNITLGVIVGLIVGIGLAFFIEYLDTSVKTIDDVERALQAPVLGVIPQNVGKLIDEGPDSPHAEAYRVLRTNVLFSRKDPKLNSLTVVSGGAGEGKSTTIFNLATIFAQSGQRVLVVDSDLRRPSLHKILNVSNSLGLTNYLLKQNSLEEVIQVTKDPNLDFLPSGKLPSSSLGILNSNQMKEFIAEVKRRYDFVFFDSPPIMGVSDASILASEVDLALLVVQYRKYPQAMTVRAKQMVEKVGGLMLGVVLNNINISQDSYYYYYSGYYYDYYSKQDDGGSKAKKNGEQKSAAAADRVSVDLKKKF